MRIISKDRDYYDSVSAYGIDQTIVYVRNEYEEEVENTNLPFAYSLPFCRDERTRKHTLNVEPFLIGFCGRFYPGVTITVRDYMEYKTILRKHVYDVKTFEKIHKKIERYGFNLGEMNKTWSIYRSLVDFLRAGGENGALTDWMIENRTPIVSVVDGGRRKHVRVTRNDSNLKRFAFAKVLDPFTAYMTLSNFVGGVMPRDGHEMVEVSDETRIRKAGFFEKSFRHRLPSDKKRKARKQR